MRIALVFLLAALLSGSAQGQSEAWGLVKAENGSTVQWVNGRIVPGGAPDSGSSLWDNMALTTWWSGAKDGYICLDWGKLPAPSSGLPDHVIDAFTFSYGSNNMELNSEEWAVYFFDSCTGWGNLGVEEAGFLFTGLPGGPQSGWYPYGWIWLIHVDLEGSGYEFLLNCDFGLGLSRVSTPLMGKTGPAVGDRPNTSGNGNTGTQNVFDIYYPNHTYNGSWWFGTGFWATWPAELFGTEGESNMTFYGIGAQGNDAGLYAAGDFTSNGEVLFLLRRNGLPLDGFLGTSLQEASRYMSFYNVTRLIGPYAGSVPAPMHSPWLGDFDKLKVDIPPGLGGITAYFQAVLCSLPVQRPVDASNGLRAN